LRLILSSIVVVALALAANPCLAKDGHVHARAGTTGASGKGASGAISAPGTPNAPSDAGATIAPPVLPPRGVTQQQIRIINPSVKTANPGTSSGSQAGATRTTAPILRNAIGQPVVPPKNLAGAQPPVSPALRAPGAVSPPILHGRSVAPPVVSAGASRVSVANATNRGSVNGATVVRPATGPSAIGGPAQAHYGINGTMVQNRH